MWPNHNRFEVNDCEAEDIDSAFSAYIEGVELRRGRSRPRPPVTNWTREVQDLFTNAARWFLAQRVTALEGEVGRLRKAINQVASLQSVDVRVETFAPEPYEAIRPFAVSLQVVDEQFVAMLVDGNINASGDTVAEAVWSLKDMMISLYERFQELPEVNLGPGPRRQLAVLKQIMRRRS